MKKTANSLTFTKKKGLDPLSPEFIPSGKYNINKNKQRIKEIPPLIERVGNSKSPNKMDSASLKEKLTITNIVSPPYIKKNKYNNKISPHKTILCFTPKEIKLLKEYSFEKYTYEEIKILSLTDNCAYRCLNKLI
jgi:hypothetical protein